MIKTKVMRILDKENVIYSVYSDESKDKQANGIAVAEKIGKDVNQVYKTLVTKGKTEIYVFIIPVHKELDFKKAAKVAKEKKIELINIKDIIRFTGYTRGGCSPIGMKKSYDSFIQEDSLLIDNIIINSGQVGLYLEINPNDLTKVINATFVDIIK